MCLAWLSRSAFPFACACALLECAPQKKRAVRCCSARGGAAGHLLQAASGALPALYGRLAAGAHQRGQWAHFVHGLLACFVDAIGAANNQRVDGLDVGRW